MTEAESLNLFVSLMRKKWGDNAVEALAGILSTVTTENQLQVLIEDLQKSNVIALPINYAESKQHIFLNETSYFLLDIYDNDKVTLKVKKYGWSDTWSLPLPTCDHNGKKEESNYGR
jgi:hypothetical protein